MQLPIHAVLDELCQALAQSDQVILEAPPGAGKTTVVPTALLDQPYLNGQKILMLEPRRIAAKTAAQRLASQLGEKPGQRVGFRMRDEVVSGPDTRIEVITEGVLTRMLSDDPSLDGVGLIIFDEFHERSIHSDIGLALTLESRALFREDQPLKILLMSATLDASGLKQMLTSVTEQAVPLIRSEGRSYPVAIEYHGSFRFDQDICQRVVQLLRKELAQPGGSILVFLPGQGEIRKVAGSITSTIAALPDCSLHTLFGQLSLAEQQAAIAKPAEGHRKLVLATAIAETSLTIDGVSIVIDSGLQRQAVFDPGRGMDRLETTLLSRASSEQRAGRAGRTGPGRCLRLWSQEQQNALAAHTTPEILRADLSALALQLFSWGIASPSSLHWLDAPPQASFQQAVDLLTQLMLVDESRNLTSHGQDVSSLPLHPRLGHMLLTAKELGFGNLACELAAILSERDPLSSDRADILFRLEALRSGHRHFSAINRQLKRLQRILGNSASRADADNYAGLCLSFAFPDRVALQRDKNSGDYLLANGQTATLPASDPLRQSPLLLVAGSGGKRHRVFLAAEISQPDIEEYHPQLLSEHQHIDWDNQQQRLLAERQQRIGKLVLSRLAETNIHTERRINLLCDQIRRRGLDWAGIDDASKRLCRRVHFFQSVFPEPQIPDFDEQTLLQELELWLGPYLNNITTLQQLRKLDFHAALLARLDWPQQQALNTQIPERIDLPSGNSTAINYEGEAPVLAAKLQEMFGCESSPTIASGRISLLIHLLSPARRPLAVTADLASFWENAYPEVRKDGRGRYPKHPWPEDPVSAEATALTKRALARQSG